MGQVEKDNGPLGALVKRGGANNIVVRTFQTAVDSRASGGARLAAGAALAGGAGVGVGGTILAIDSNVIQTAAHVATSLPVVGGGLEGAIPAAALVGIGAVLCRVAGGGSATDSQEANEIAEYASGAVRNVAVAGTLIAGAATAAGLITAAFGHPLPTEHATTFVTEALGGAALVTAGAKQYFGSKAGPKASVRGRSQLEE